MGTGIHNAKVEGIKEGGELPRLCNFIAESAIRFLSKLSCRWRRSYRAAHHEAVKLRLADKTFYTPDFVVIRADGGIELHEVKGHWEDDARVKIKVAATQHPWFRFLAVKAGKTGWQYETFGGGA